MSDVANGPKQRKLPRRQRSIYQVHYNLRRQDEVMAKPLAMPSAPLSVQAYELQVAGHRNDKTEEKFLGLLQCSNGRVLKPILKESQKREVDFYNRVSTSTNPELVELRKHIPKYYGCRKFTYNGFEQEYIMLEDLTERMLDPCIMDVKIGRRTWDPQASLDKIRREESKYALCKEEYAFCIPGYQVYKLATGKLQKYNKEYGKKLHGPMVRAAMKNFLNGLGSSLCRALILQFLSALWGIQKWAARQTAVTLYCTSLLLVYDAARLRDCCGENRSSFKCRTQTAPRRKSIHSLHNPAAGSNFSGQLSSKGPVYRKVNSVPLSSMTLAQQTFAPLPVTKSPWSEALDKLNHNHSFEHNYEDKLSKIKMNYRATLDQLVSDSPTPNPWGTVKIIDFAHAFFNEEDNIRVDTNFREGIDNVVAMFESLLRETDDQVY
ncbi:inositol polyphosphate multikinase [Bicyclus anynana]|uniref:Kinase n=1 Tax=Bicyclus anynana TaxID=110368 RepID=A0ABM3LVX7_BICAN|nr:inositol polyphosphate multikinase [Bicyclus anynana]